MKISISPSVITMAAIILLSGRAYDALIPLFAAFLHECGHILVAFFLSIPIKRIKLNLFGALIETPPLACTYKKEALLAFAGPFMNILTGSSALMIFEERALYFSVASFAFALINLLPIESFDGGRILSCLLLNKYEPSVEHNISEICSLLSVFVLWCISVYFILRTGAYLSLFVFSGALFSHIFLKSD